MAPTLDQFVAAVERHFLGCSETTLEYSYWHVKGGLSPESFGIVQLGAYLKHHQDIDWYVENDQDEPLLILLVNRLLADLMPENDRRVVAQARL